MINENELFVSGISLHDYAGDMSKEWYVGFSYTHPDTGKRVSVQVRLKINSFKKRAERYLSGNAVVKVVKNALVSGWLPYAENIKTFLISDHCKETQTPAPIVDIMTIQKAFKFAIEKGRSGWANKTIHDYENIANMFVEACEVLSLHEKAIQDFGKTDALTVLEHLLSTRKNWTNYSYNKNKIYLSALFSVLENWEIVEHNVMKKIKARPIVEPERKYLPLTDDEKRQIQQSLYLRHYNYLVYLMTIYHTGMRPKEVLMLQIKDVYLPNREIIIRPNMDAGNSKTKKVRHIPINDELFSFLREKHLHEYQKEYYVFGSLSSPECQLRIPAADPRYFSPQKNFMLRDTATKLWNTLIRSKKTGLGINKHMYAMKHTGADDKILAGVSLEALRSMYGHSSTQMTERYITKLKEINKKAIIEKSPAFIPTKRSV